MKDATHIPNSWHIGTVLPGGYRVTDRLGKGGMGVVFLVERRVSTKIQTYAVKILNPQISRSADQVRNFLREIRTWIDLPDHPHLAGCRFFRTIDETLAIFAEYVEGSSLDKWILNNKNASLEILLDLAIQMAWGLQCAHESGVIHQDIKPSNVLVSIDGIAKITDFGLARHRLTGKEHPQQTDSGHTYLVSSKGMTLPYCSMEQAMGIKLSRKTDMWSYALTVLQMFNGALTWFLGSAAEQVLAYYLEKGPAQPMPAMPEGVVQILQRCFKEEPAERWRDMSVIASMLMDEYKKCTGREFSREYPGEHLQEKATEAQPAGSRERNTVGGGQWVEPEALLKMALEQTGTEMTFCWDDVPECNQTTERGSALRDIEAFELVENIYRTHQSMKEYDDEISISLANVMFNKALAVEACKDMAHAAEIYREIRNMLDKMDNARACELSARAALNASTCRCITGEKEQAIRDIDFAVTQYRNLIAGDVNVRCYKNMVISLMNQSVILDNYGRHEDGLKSMQEALIACEDLLQMDNCDENWNQMGIVQLNLGMAMNRRNRYDEALDAVVQAYYTYEMLMERRNAYDIAAYFALAHFYRARILRRKHAIDDAERFLVSGRKFIMNQIHTEKREQLRGDLAKMLEQLSEIKLLQNNYSSSLDLMAEAVTIIERIAVQEDEMRHMINFRRITLKHAAFMYAESDNAETMKRGAKALAMWLKAAREDNWTPESTVQFMEETVKEVVTDLEYFQHHEIASRIQRLIHTMCKKV